MSTDNQNESRECGFTINFLDSEKTEVFIQREYADVPGRLHHILVVAERVRQSARDINELNPGMHIDENAAFCAGLVHDIGYLEQIAHSGFHPLDGYNFLLSQGFGQLARHILLHSCAIEEAELLGISLPQISPSLITKLITYWDVQVKPGGDIVSYEERLRDIVMRYGERSIVVQANINARCRVQLIIDEINRLLLNMPA